jgi:hypothetical protein
VNLPSNAQVSRVLVLGKGIEEGVPELLAKLKADLDAGPQAVILTGDFIRNKHRVDKNPLLDSRVGQLLNAYQGKIYVVPGELEYGPYQNNSIEQLTRLEESLSEFSGKFQLVPTDGCPGPYAIEFDEWVLIFINTSRFLHQGEKMPFSECGLEDESSFFGDIENLLEVYSDRPALVVGHHPMRSRGNHAGYFPWQQHLLPPVLGSIYAGFRKYIGGLQDIRSERYTSLIESLAETFE